MEELHENMREYQPEHQAEYEEWLKKRGGESNEENKRRTSKRIKEGF